MQVISGFTILVGTFSNLNVGNTGSQKRKLLRHMHTYKTHKGFYGFLFQRQQNDDHVTSA